MRTARNGQWQVSNVRNLLLRTSATLKTSSSAFIGGKLISRVIIRNRPSCHQRGVGSRAAS
ncbi:hypothetical protein [Mesorhizobium sp.]|uniref:hypothetical protein n=1 Tax=Mesorhizobium sp. TaxID=1871066 RepID=UPI00257FF6ED|nr:hypothetical protein [Mesorhizobium sp.]